MANFQPPPTYAMPILVEETTDAKGEKHSTAKFAPVWLKWFLDLGQILSASGGTTGTIVHNDTSSKQGGQASEYYHLTAAQHTAIGTLGSLTANTVVFSDATSALATEAAFGYNTSTNTLTVDNATIATSLTVTGLTATRVPFASTAGLIVDDSGFTFNTTGDILTVGAINVAGSTAPTSGWYLPSADLIRTPNSVTIDNNLVVSDNTTLGATSADTFTINAGTWTIGSNYTATRAIGAAAAGTNQPERHIITFSGDAGGTTAVFGHTFTCTGSGANAVATLRGVDTDFIWGGSNTLTTYDGWYHSVRVTSTGAATTVQGMTYDFRFSASVTTANILNFRAPVISGGTTSTFRGLNIGNLGNASITTAIGIDIADFTASTTMRGIECSISSGTGKHNLYIDGTAINAIAGNTRIGGTTDPTVALDVTGAALISSTLGVTGTVSANTITVLSGTTATVYNATATTVNAFGAATTLALGAGSGTMTVGNATLTLTNATTVNVNGASPTLASSSTGTLTLFNTNLLTVNAFGAATTIGIGATTGTTTINNDLAVADQVASVGGVTTAGNFGVPLVVAYGRSTAQTAAVASVATFTVGASDGTFEVSGNVRVTTSTNYTFDLRVVWTDEESVERDWMFSFTNSTGSTAPFTATSGGGGVGTTPMRGIPLLIRCKASTAITIKTSGTFTTVTYNVEGVIKQIN